jgi:hypothetical protein
MPDEMLVKYLLGEATAAERDEVLQWINESKENKDHYNGLKLIWKESVKLAPASDMDADNAWMRFKTRVQNNELRQTDTRRTYSLNWLKAAAVLLLLCGGGSLAWYAYNQDNSASVAMQITPKPPIHTTGMDTPPASARAEADNIPQAETAPADVHATAIPARISKLKLPDARVATKATWQPLKVNDSWVYERSRTKEFICNATPCPIEICIIQMIRCDNGQPSTVASCSTLEPDQAGQLHFNAMDNVTNECNATVEEIRIKRVTTGETIVLTRNSKPSTAEDVFNYLMGQKQGDILAGIFQADCNDRCNENSLRLGKDYGHLIFQ